MHGKRRSQLKGSTKLLFIIVVIAFILSIPVNATNFTSSHNGKKRYISEGANFIDKIIFRLKGCEIVHELSDAVAIKCPERVALKNVREDRVFTVNDIEAAQQIGAARVWNELNYTGKGVVIAVIDTGIDYSHEELADSIAGGRSFVDYTPDYKDDNGHGTHVAGIITANGINNAAKGIAPDAAIFAAKVCDSQGLCYESDIAAAIEYIVNNKDAIKVKILSISLGGAGTSGKHCDYDYLAKKVNWAYNNGLLVVAAAGNTRGIVSSPACASKAIAVGAVDKSDNLAWFSGSGKALDIVAPGVEIYSTWLNNGYASASGTSMAAPHVSATAALILEKNSSYSLAEIKEALYETAIDLGYSSREQGNGRVNAYDAVLYSPSESSGNKGKGAGKGKKK